MNTKRAFFIVLVSFSFAGCNTLRRLVSPQSHPAEVQTLPDDYIVSGTTHIDREMIQPLRVEDSTIIVRVKRVGEDWHTCNAYEIQVDTKGAGGGVGFLDQVEVSAGGLLSLNKKPVAPKGTVYEIRSIRAGSPTPTLY